nr:CRISPR-associated helicase Cas3' [Micromonospora sp. DSM 115978]
MSDRRALWAHSPAPRTDNWHGLREHLLSTGLLAQRFAAPFGGGDLAYTLGVLHDVGKASCTWQAGLAKVAGSDRPVGIDHKGLGTRIARERGLGSFALGIYGHHGGLIDADALTQQLSASLARAGDVASAETALPDLLPGLPDDLSQVIPAQWQSDPLVGEMAMRLCYSALVDADSLDTAAHFAQLTQPRVRDDVDFGQLHKRFEQRRAEVLARRPGSPVDGVREGIYADCLASAELPPGIFRMPVPTGGGKTLAAGGFALRHAERHGMRRVIVAVPFLTITEQNAAVYRNLLDDQGSEPIVLEHHSQVDFDDPAAGKWARLAAENWDAPFVVTTFVRLFESLYGRKPSAMRRVHRLAGAVIVLDEVQALPHHLLVPILNGLKLLVEHFGSTVLFSSATQPDFWALNEFKDVKAVDVVRNPGRLVTELRRVRFEWQVDPEPTLADIADQAAEERAALVVVNTTANAQQVFQQWQDAVPDGIAIHLSTRMCPSHRQRELARARARLRAEVPVLLVATQLIEAGVDIDFPVVFRAMAPADSLLQAAGRANREGRLTDGGRVVVFAPQDGSHPPSYKVLIGCTERAFGPGKPDLDDLTALAGYYRDLYDTLNLEHRGHLGRKIERARQRWQFQTVTDGPIINAGEKARNRKEAFRLIDDQGIAVVTPHGAETEEERGELEHLIERIRTAPVPQLADLRRLQPYTTNLHVSAFQKTGVKALMRPILGEVKVGGLAEWVGGYDPHTGIEIDPKLEDFLQ